MMQKRLKPTLRDKKRYILARGSRDDIEKAILEFIGILGYAKAGVKFVKKEWSRSGEIILAINREKLNEVRGALALKGIHVLGVSGTLKGLSSK